MFETFALTLREGIEIALVIGIILAYLRRTKRADLNKHVYLGISVSVVASVIAGIIIISFSAKLSPLFEGVMYLLAAAFIASMIIFMQHHAKHLKEHLHDRFERVISKWEGPGIFILTVLLIFREGAEIIIFLTATVAGTGYFAFIEFAVAILLSILFGFFFIKGSLKIRLGPFFKVTAIMLSIIVFQLAFEGIHELEEAGAIPMGEGPAHFFDIFSSGLVHNVVSGVLFIFSAILLFLTFRRKR